MAWFGIVSAWAALAMGALFGVNAYFQFATGVSGWIYVAITGVLIVAALRTLQKKSGSLRLLAGAWGIAAGLQITPLSIAFSLPAARFSTGDFAFMAISLICLVLTVLHKERT